MSPARTKQRPTSGMAAAIATSGVESWALPTAAGAIALVAAVATSFGLVAAPIGLAVVVLGLLAVIAERGFAKAAPLGTAAVVGMALVGVAICYPPFQALFLPGDPAPQPS